MYVCNVYMYACMVSIYKAIRSEIRLRFAMWQVSAGARTAGSLVDCRQRHFQHRWAQTTSSQAGDELMQRSRIYVDGAPRDKKRWSMVVVECRRWALAVLTLYSSDGTWGGKCKTQNITHTHTRTHMQAQWNMLQIILTSICSSQLLLLSADERSAKNDYDQLPTCLMSPPVWMHSDCKECWCSSCGSLLARHSVGKSYFVYRNFWFWCLWRRCGCQFWKSSTILSWLQCKATTFFFDTSSGYFMKVWKK